MYEIREMTDEFDRERFDVYADEADLE